MSESVGGRERCWDNWKRKVAGICVWLRGVVVVIDDRGLLRLGVGFGRGGG